MNGIRQVYLNGEFLAPEAARVSAFDRGFIFGDGVYEVIPVFGGRLFRLPQHLARLDSSLREIRLVNPLAGAEWQKIFERLVAIQGGGDLSIYLEVTRGVAPRDHAFPAKVTPTVFAYAAPLKYPPKEQVEQGISAITAPDIRWLRCDIKAIALLPNALLRQQAIDAGTAEAILLRDGFMTEGAASNIFVIKNGRAVTPPKGPLILPGVTRDLVLELALAHGVPCAEVAVSETELRNADEVWLTSSTKEVLAITRLDGKPVGAGRPGPLHARMLAFYKDYKRAFCEGQVN
ncbi:MAG: D-amino acid aminotransferase [Gammaproteobacteria bacterium]|nr:MAG: D-amino acid aminotransferase [Gammaproteobacteria bacterium]